MKHYQKIIGLPLEKRVALILLSLFVSAAILWSLRDFFYKSKLKKENAFVIALIYDVQRSKSGPDYYIKYSVEGKSYSDSFKPGFSYDRKKGDYIFIKILKEKPAVYKRMNYITPDCLTLQKKMDSLFVSLPDNPADLCK